MGAGAKHILVPGMPDLGLTPGYIALGPVVAGEASFLSNYFNTELLKDLPGGATYYDTFGFMHTIVADPSAYGFTNVTDALPGGSHALQPTRSVSLLGRRSPNHYRRRLSGGAVREGSRAGAIDVPDAGHGTCRTAGVLRRKMAA